MGPAYPGEGDLWWKAVQGQSKTGEDRDYAFQSCDSTPDRDASLRRGSEGNLTWIWVSTAY